MSHEYTLLIVESSILADRIHQFRIPWLEVIATNGFLWKPVYKKDSHRLAARAVPDKRELRKEIREKSAWAKKIIIATDNDPSGDFIAWSLLHYFSDSYDFLRTYIHNPEPVSVIKQISSAFKADQNHLKEQLELRYLLNELWNENFPNISPQLAALSFLFSHIHTLNDYRDTNGNHYTSINYDHNYSDKTYPLKVINQGKDYHLHPPPSIFDLLQQSAIDLDDSFTTVTEGLFRLFTHRVEAEYVHLISYPRTVNRKYYEYTWKNIEEYFGNINPEKLLKPKAFREFADPDEPHEGLRPVHLHAFPESVRPLLNNKLYKLYTTIYKLFLKSTEIHEVSSYVDNNENEATYVSVNVFSDIAEKSISLERCATISAVGHQLYQWGLTRPARFGSQLDNWIKHEILILNKIYLEPGPILSAGDQKPETAFGYWKQAQPLIKESDREGLLQIFNA